MCVTNIYTDRFPDGKEVEFRQTSICQYGQPGRPCPTLSTLENPTRKIQWGEPTAEFMFTRMAPAFPHTPPRSATGSYHRNSGGDTTSEEGGRHRRHSKRRSGIFGSRPRREHRKERIVIVDAPPTPRTPPPMFSQSFTAPASPATPPFIIDGIRRGRPIIVDERPLFVPRVPSPADALRERLARRSRSQSRPRFSVWDSPSSSHTSFDSRARREEEREREERRRRLHELEEQEAERAAERRRAQRILEQDERIRRRPAVPLRSPALRQPFLRPVVDQSEALQGMMAGLNLEDRLADRAIVEASLERRRAEERDRAIRARFEAQQEEAMKQRLRERQLPRRRFSVGPGYRRHRVLYDDGIYRWE